MATLQTLPEVTTILPAGTSAGVTSLAMRTFFYAVFKHTRLVVGTFLLIFFAAAVTAVVRPTIWMATTTVLVKLGETAQLALTVTPSPGANTLQISYIGRDPQRAARMVNRITDVYIDHHNDVYRTRGMHSLYDEQLRILKAQMKRAQRRFRAH